MNAPMEPGMQASMLRQDAGGYVVETGPDLRIAIVGPVPPPPGGMAMQTAQLARLLREEGVGAQLVSTNPAYPAPWIAKLRGVRAAVRLAGYIPRLFEAARANDVVHVMANSGWSWDLFAMPAIAVARLCGRPVVVNYRGGEAAEFLRHAHRRVRMTLKLAHAVAVPSGFLQRVFAEHGMSTRIVPNIIDTARFHPEGMRGMPKAIPNIVIARHLEALYGIDVALEAFALLLKSVPNARLTIAGIGPMKKRLHDQVNALGIASRVLFAGKLGTNEVAALMRTSDLMLNPSRADNMPNSVLEAWASGLPVVSTNVGGVPHLVRDGETAVLVPRDDAAAMADAMRRVLVEPGMWWMLRENGLAEAERYTWTRVKPLWMSIYRELLRREPA